MIVFGLALFGLGLFTHTIYIWAAGVALMLLTGLRYLDLVSKLDLYEFADVDDGAGKCE